MPGTEDTRIALNHVRADHADAFEHWLRSVVAPAVHAHQPHLAGRWRVLRASEAEDGVVVFAFVFDGGTDDDWDLRRVLEEALGGAGADRALADMDEMLAQEQYGWTFTELRLDA